MKKYFIFSILLNASVFAQTSNVQKSTSGNRITADLKFGSSRVLEIESGATLQLDAGATITGLAVGDTSSNTTTSVDGELVLFSGTAGKTIKRATGSGLLKLTSGVGSIAGAGTDYLAPAAIGTTVQGILTNSAGLASALSDETGTGVAVFNTSPTFTTQITAPKLVYSGSVFETFGTGSPEGVVTANISSVYHRTDGASGTSLYIKSSGTGNTGWVAVGAGGGGGSGDMISTNNLSDVTSASTALKNIDGAGTYYYSIKDYCSGTQLTGGADATTGCQSALNAIQTAMLANNGGTYILNLGDSILRIDGALQTTNGCNSQLILPAIPNSTNAQCTLVIKGSGPTSAQFGVHTNSVIDPTRGAKIKSTLTTGGGTQPSVISGRCSGPLLTMLLFVLDGVEVETIKNPLISGIDCSYVGAFSAINSTVVAGTYSLDNTTFPTHTDSVGIIAPLVGNNVENHFHGTGVLGFYTGYRLSEHAYGDLMAFGCSVGLETSLCYHPITLSRFECIGCVTGIKAVGGACRLTIESWVIEHEGSGVYNTTTDLSDSSNYLQGFANYTIVLGSVGIDHTFTKSGGGKFNAMDTGVLTPSIQLSDNSPVYFGVKNASAGSSASARFRATNDSGVFGELSVFSSAAGIAALQNTTAVAASNNILLFSDSNVATGGTNPIDIQAGGYSAARNLRAFGSGGVAIGTASDPGAGNFAIQGFMPALTIQNASASGRLFVKSTNNASNAGTEYYVKDSGGTTRSGGSYFIPATSDANSFLSVNGNTSDLHLSVYGDGRIRFNSYGAGTMTTDSSGFITATSDIRLKDKQGDFTRGIDAILKLQPILYRWKASSGHSPETVYAGFSAQNVQSAIPEAVGHMSDGMLTLQDRPVIAALVNAVKELVSENKKLEARIRDLERK